MSSDVFTWRDELAASPYLPETPPLRVARLTLASLSLSVFCLVVWAGFTQVNEIASSYGQVLPSGRVQVIQHLEGGIVREVLVREGELVQQGQVLMRLDASGARSDLNQLKQEQSALEMQRIRIQAILDGTVPDYSSMSALPEHMRATEESAYQSSKQAQAREEEVIRAQIAQRREALGSLQARANTLSQNLRISEESLNIKSALTAKGYFSRLKLLEIQENVNSLRGERQSIGQEIERTRSEIAEYELRLSSLSANRRDEAYRQLTQLNSEIAKNGEAITKFSDRVGRLEVRSPVDGIVKGIEINTVGGIVAPGQKLMEVVPSNEVLNVEARIRPSDVGQLRSGMPVDVKVHAFDYTRYGALRGTLANISATTFVDEANQTYYRGTVSLKQGYLGGDPSRNQLVPGMTVDAEIITGRRSLLAYLLKPIRNAADTAFTEQ